MGRALHVLANFSALMATVKAACVPRVLVQALFRQLRSSSHCEGVHMQADSACVDSVVPTCRHAAGFP